MTNPNEGRQASKVTVGVGAGIPRVFKDVDVQIDYGRALVEIWTTDDGRSHVATAPLGATLIEWEISAPPRHRISIRANGHARPEALSA
jgi:hypothetical protein